MVLFGKPPEIEIAMASAPFLVLKRRLFRN
jgi:hypothetical protein